MELWKVLHLAWGPALGNAVETQPLKCRGGAAKCQINRTPSDRKTCRVLSPLVRLHESWISIADNPPSPSPFVRLSFDACSVSLRHLLIRRVKSNMYDARYEIFFFGTDIYQRMLIVIKKKKRKTLSREYDLFGEFFKFITKNK